MKRKNFTPLASFPQLFVLSLVCYSGVALADQVVYYRVSIDNLTEQPLSPPVAATHQGALNMFELETPASAELLAITEKGNQRPMFDLFSGSRKVTEVIDTGTPLAAKKATTFRIKAHPGNRLSLATKVICTNNGFTGLNRVRLPKRGAEIIWAANYQAATEENTKLGLDIIDSCNTSSPIAPTEDPNGQENNAVDNNPTEPHQHQPNIQATGNLILGDYGKKRPVAKITITHVADDAIKFLARLSGAGEVPPILANNPWGQAEFKLNDNKTELSYRLKALRLVSGVIQAHIHLGLPDDNGPAIASLFGPAGPAADERLNTRGKLTQRDLAGPLAGDFPGFVNALRAGELYVNVQSKAYPLGEIRGQVGAK